MKRDAQQSALPSAHDARCDIEKRRGNELSILNDANAAPLLHDEQSSIATRRCQINRIVESGRNFGDSELEIRRSRLSGVACGRTGGEKNRGDYRGSGR